MKEPRGACIAQDENSRKGIIRGWRRRLARALRGPTAAPGRNRQPWVHGWRNLHTRARTHIRLTYIHTVGHLRDQAPGAHTVTLQSLCTARSYYAITLCAFSKPDGTHLPRRIILPSHCPHGDQHQWSGIRMPHTNRRAPSRVHPSHRHRGAARVPIAVVPRGHVSNSLRATHARASRLDTRQVAPLRAPLLPHHAHCYSLGANSPQVFAARRCYPPLPTL